MLRVRTKETWWELSRVPPYIIQASRPEAFSPPRSEHTWRRASSQSQWTMLPSDRIGPILMQRRLIWRRRCLHIAHAACHPAAGKPGSGRLGVSSRSRASRELSASAFHPRIARPIPIPFGTGPVMSCLSCVRFCRRITAVVAARPAVPVARVRPVPSAVGTGHFWRGRLGSRTGSRQR